MDSRVIEGQTSRVEICGGHRSVLKIQTKFREFNLIDNEVRHLCTLASHLAFPKVIGIGVALDRFVMSYCGEALTKKNLPPYWKEQLINIGSVLDHVGIIHRDIRPENFTVWNDRVHLIDFGWAMNKKLDICFGPDCIGDTYKSPKGWDDQYSLQKVIKYYGG